MAYVRHHWECNEVVTATQLNNIETGIEEALNCCGGGEEPEPSFMLINAETEDSTTTLDATWQEILDALSAGTPCFVLFADENDSSMFMVSRAYIDNGVYTVIIAGVNYTATTADDYPSYTSSIVNPA